MKKVIIKSVEENKSPRFVKTNFVTAEREGVEFTWETVKSHDSVHVMVFNCTTNEVLLVKQVRIPVLVNGSKDGIMYEACAGIVDKDLPLSYVVKEEILEELGYDVDVSNIDYIRSLRHSVGTNGSTGYLFYATTTESEKVSEGGGIHDEDIEVVRIPLSEVDEFISNVETDAVTMFLLSYVQKSFGE